MLLTAPCVFPGRHVPCDLLFRAIFEVDGCSLGRTPSLAIRLQCANEYVIYAAARYSVWSYSGSAAVAVYLQIGSRNMTSDSPGNSASSARLIDVDELPIGLIDIPR